MSSSTDSKRRIAISDAQRKEIRDYYREESAREPTSKKLPYHHVRLWFHERTDHKLSDSTISRILSPAFDHLDEPGSIDLTRERNRDAKWPALENALYEWHQRMELQKVNITGGLLKEMAVVFWNSLPDYAGQSPPKFSTGWLDGFKHRFNIKLRVRKGEAADVDREALKLAASEIANHRTVDPVNQINIQHQPERERLGHAVDIEGKRTIREALHALSELRIYEQQQEDGYSEAVKFLSKYELVIQKRKAALLGQS